jgi:hypothetical protein
MLSVLGRLYWRHSQRVGEQICRNRRAALAIFGLLSIDSRHGPPQDPIGSPRLSIWPEH